MAPTYGINADKVKLHNTGPFVYLLTRKLRQITDGLSKTAFVGEIRDGHTAASSNIWTIGSRHVDSLRTTDALLNTPPGANIPPFYLDGTVRLNGAFGSDHPEWGELCVRRCPRDVHRRYRQQNSVRRHGHDRRGREY